MAKIRKSIFETNSSSTHSIVIEDNNHTKPCPIDTNTIDITIETEEFYPERVLADWREKANYLYSWTRCIADYDAKASDIIMENVHEAIKKYFPNANINYVNSRRASADLSNYESWAKTYTNVERLLFGTKAFIVIIDS